MGATEIFQLIAQGLTLLPIAIQAGQSIETRIQQLIALAESGSGGTPISADELARIRAQFDADIADFNAPMT